MADPNVAGQAYSLTVLAPIDSKRVSDLVNYLDNVGSEDASPLSKVGATHFARWVVMDAPVFEGGWQRRDGWRAPRLLFTSNFDGELDPYLERLGSVNAPTRCGGTASAIRAASNRLLSLAGSSATRSTAPCSTPRTGG
jgi:hypothetical protein